MAFTYEWKIVELERNVADGGVYMTHYTVKVTDDETGKSQTMNATYGFSPDASDASFVAYEDLTEEMVIGWIQGQGSPDFDTLKDEVESRLADALNLVLNPVTATGMPWATSGL